MWLWLWMGIAWGASWALHIPDRQDASVWEDALLLTGLSLADSSTSGAAEVVFADGRWWLRVPAADGSGWRRATIPAPDSPAAREAIARQARNMLADPSAGIESHWEPDFSTLLPTRPASSPATAPPPEAPVPARSPPILVPRLGARPPQPEVLPPQPIAWTVPVPAQVVSYPWSLRLPPPPDATPSGTRAGWLRLGAGPSWRPQTAPAVGLQVEGGLQQSASLSLGLGGSWQSSAGFSDLPGARAVQTLGLHGSIWWTPATAVPLQGGLLLGVGGLRFQQEGTTIARLARPSAGLDLAYGTRLQGFLRATTELWPVTLLEEDDPIGTLYPSLWLGLRVQAPLPLP